MLAGLPSHDPCLLYFNVNPSRVKVLGCLPLTLALSETPRLAGILAACKTGWELILHSVSLICGKWLHAGPNSKLSFSMEYRLQ